MSDEPPLETYRHLKQLILLLTCLERLWRDRQDFFVGGNMSIYYSVRQLKSEDMRGPDFFVVLVTERREHKSCVVWAEDGKYPNFIPQPPWIPLSRAAGRGGKGGQDLQH